MLSYKIDRQLSLSLPRPKKDAAGLYKMIASDRDRISRFLPWADSLKDVQAEEDFLRETNLNFVKEASLNLVINYQDKAVGMISLNRIIHLNRSTDIGYWLGKDFRRKGIMTKAVLAITKIAFKEYDLNRLIIRAAVENTASNATAKKAGFVLEARLKQSALLLDGFHDENQYRLLKNERF